MKRRHVAVIGAGWSGLATATRLAEAGHGVTVLEAATVPGGRARTVTLAGEQVDNGQHILLGAYGDSLALMRRVGIDPERTLHRMPLDLDVRDREGGLHLKVPRGPATPALVWGLARTRGLSARERLQGLLTAARLQRPPAVDQPAGTWLAACGQPPALIRRLWQPLCLAALNTPAERASARVFAATLGTAFSGRGTSDLLLPRHDLGALLPEPAVAWLRARGAEVRLGSRVHGLSTGTARWHLHLRDKDVEADDVVIATDPSAAARLLAPLAGAAARLAATIDSIAIEPITTVWLREPANAPRPLMQGRLDGPAQWLFDRRVCGQPGLRAAVISGPGPHMDWPRDAVGASVMRQLGGAGRMPEVIGTIREKRATFAATPQTEAVRPAVGSPLPGLWVTGDYIANGLPATLEGAARNGHQCATDILHTRKEAA